MTLLAPSKKQPRPCLASRQAGGSSPLIWLLVLGIVAMTYYAFVPDYFAIRDGVRIDLAARALERCDTVLAEHKEDLTGIVRDAVPLSVIDDALVEWEKPPLTWPAAADLSTFSTTGEYSSVEVVLRGGRRIVTALDTKIDHVN